MSTNLACFLVGLALVPVWLTGLKRGIMVGLVFGLVRRVQAPARFWYASAFYGALALGFLVFPLLTWLGLRS